jgi:hypothetical protein
MPQPSSNKVVHFAKPGKWWVALCGKRIENPGGKHNTVNLERGVSNCPKCCAKAQQPLAQF